MYALVDFRDALRIIGSPLTKIGDGIGDMTKSFRMVSEGLFAIARAIDGHRTSVLKQKNSDA